MAVLEAIREFWKSEGLGPGRVLVGFSGGPDSTALLHGLSALAPDLRLQVVAAHLHHGQRGNRADEDARHCGQLAAQLGAALLSEKANVPELARERSIGIEEAGREARYRFFERAADAQSADWIATGHTRDDHVETILMNLARGSGLSGLHGIPKRRGRIIRPILSVSRAETAGYCAKQHLPVLEDSTNRDMRHTRNRLRKALKDSFVQVFGQNIYTSLARMACIAEAEDDYLSTIVQQALPELLEPQHPVVELLALHPREYRVAADKLLKLPLAIQRRAIRELVFRLHPFAELDFALIDAVLDGLQDGQRNGYSVQESCVKLDITDSAELVVREPVVAPAWSIALTGCHVVPLLGANLCVCEGPPPRDPAAYQAVEAVFDRHSIKGPLRAHFPDGSGYVPLGFDGYRSLSDLLSTSGFPQWLRKLAPVVSDEDGPIWVLGARIADRVRVTTSCSLSGYLAVKPSNLTV